MLSDSTVRRFWSKVDRRDAKRCWTWNAARNNRGYGVLYVDGQNKNMGAHRVSYLINVGQIPDGMCVLHSCDNPPCVNPNHLFIGTNADNNADMMQKGRCVSIKHGQSHTPLYGCWSNHSQREVLGVEWTEFDAMLECVGDASLYVYRLFRDRKLGPNNWTPYPDRCENGIVFLNGKRQTLQQCGDILGVSRQRAHQLLQSGKLATRIDAAVASRLD